MFDLIDLYPEHLQGKTMREILKGEQFILNEQEKAIESLMSEFFIETAVYSLPAWCRFAGVDYEGGIDIDILRSNIKAALKAKEVTTVQVIKSIAESYSNGLCEVIEDYGNYKFTVRFIGTIGVPARIDEIKKIIERLKPAHLACDFEFKYRTWGDINKLGKSWESWKSKGKIYNDLREGEI